MRTLNNLEKQVKPAKEVSHTKMGLSDLLQIQRCTLNSCSVILEELSSDMELDENNEHNSCDSENIPVNDRLSASGRSSHLPTNDILNLNIDCNERIRADEIKNRLSNEEQTTDLTSNRAFYNAPSGKTQNCDLTKSTESRQDQKESLSNSNKSEIKSGNLVFICNDQNQKQCTQNPLKETGVSTTCSRYPVTVKIYQNHFERYAIISRSRRHPTMPSFCLKLKQSQATQSASNPSHIVVVIDGYEGKSFHFEASSPDNASEWVEAFSFPTESRCHRSEFPHQTSPSELSNLNQSEQSKENKGLSRQFSFSSCHSPKIPRSPLLPVLSESNDEEESEE